MLSQQKTRNSWNLLFGDLTHKSMGFFAPMMVTNSIPCCYYGNKYEDVDTAWGSFLWRRGWWVCIPWRQEGRALQGLRQLWEEDLRDSASQLHPRWRWVLVSWLRCRQRSAQPSCLRLSCFLLKPVGSKDCFSVSVTDSFVTVFSTVLSSELRNWELSAWAS